MKLYLFYFLLSSCRYEVFFLVFFFLQKRSLQISKSQPKPKFSLPSPPQRSWFRHHQRAPVWLICTKQLQSWSTPDWDFTSTSNISAQHTEMKKQETYLNWGGQIAATTSLAELKWQCSPLAFPPKDTGHPPACFFALQHAYLGALWSGGQRDIKKLPCIITLTERKDTSNRWAGLFLRSYNFKTELTSLQASVFCCSKAQT